MSSDKNNNRNPSNAVENSSITSESTLPTSNGGLPASQRQESYDNHQLSNYEEQQCQSVSDLRHVSPYHARQYPRGSNFRPGIQTDASRHWRVYSEQTPSDCRTIMCCFLCNHVPKHNIRQAFRLVPAVCEYMHWCIQEYDYPKAFTIHTVLNFIGFVDPTIQRHAVFNSPHDLPEFYQLIYSLINSAIDNIPIQRIRSSWLPSLAQDDRSTIINTRDVFLTQHPVAKFNQTFNPTRTNPPLQANAMH